MVYFLIEKEEFLRQVSLVIQGHAELSDHFAFLVKAYDDVKVMKEEEMSEEQKEAKIIILAMPERTIQTMDTLSEEYILITDKNINLLDEVIAHEAARIPILFFIEEFSGMPGYMTRGKFQRLSDVGSIINATFFGKLPEKKKLNNSKTYL